MIEAGWLAPFKTFAPPPPDLSGVRTVAGEYHEGELSTACDKVELIANIVTTWLEKAKDRPTLVYGVDRKHAQHLQERFIEAGISTGYVDCNTAMFEREKIFDSFRASATKIICNVATLDTGLDLPSIGCIVDARPTKSRIRFVQTIGWSLRAAAGKDCLLILDHAGNHLKLGRVTEIDFGTLDDGAPTVPAKTKRRSPAERKSNCAPSAGRFCRPRNRANARNAATCSPLLRRCGARARWRSRRVRQRRIARPQQGAVR